MMTGRNNPGEAIYDFKHIPPPYTWPRFIHKLVLQESPFTRSQRIQIICFLYGNGITKSFDIMRIISTTRLRDRSALVHARSILVDIVKGTYDHKWTYYSLQENCLLYLNGDVSLFQHKINKFNLKLSVWDRYCKKYKTDLGIQLSFFGGDTDVARVIYATVLRQQP